MDRTIEIDDALVKAAQEATGETDEKAAAEKVLRQAVAQTHQALNGMLELAGTDPLREDYDYKALRQGRSDDSDR